MFGITLFLKTRILIFRNLYRKRDFLFIFFLCLLISLFIHFLLLKKFKSFEISSFNSSSFDKIIPRYLQLKRVEIDSASLSEENKTKPLLIPIEVTLPENKISSDENLVIKNSKPEELKFDEISEEESSNLLESQLIATTKSNSQQVSLELEQLQNGKQSSLKDLVPQQISTPASYSQLEQLVEERIPLTSKTAPILLPTDLLFEYNLDKLKTDAEKSLEKLALLIKRNPKSEFVVEGFTDSFGSDEYNLGLSQRRAESIKKWLVEHQLIDESKIKTKGFGKTKFLVPSSGTIEQQKLNRRVEIVIH